MIEWLQEWYLAQCNGDWEHDYGVRITTVDNPGWNLEIDLSYTNIRLSDLEWRLVEKSDDDWYGFKVEDNIFNAAGDPMKLGFIISLFKDIIENNM